MAFRRVLTIAGLSASRAFRSPVNLLSLVGLPVLLAFGASLLFIRGTGPQGLEGGIAILHEPPRGSLGAAEYGRLRTSFGVYLMFAMSALVARAAAFREERRRGTLQRALAMGVPYREIVAAHVLSIALVGVGQSAIVVAVTGLLGAPWLASGWAPLLVSIAGALAACGGIAVAVTGLARIDGQVQLISSAVPVLLALTGGVFFSLEAAPGAFQQLARLNPLSWCVRVLEEGFVYGGVAGQAGPAAALLLVGVLGTVVGVQGLRRRSS